MRKTLKYSVIGLLSLLIIGFLVLTFSLDYIVKSNIEEIGSEMTQTPVTVSGVSISLFSGEGTISGFRVANPEKFETEEAMSIDQFDIEIDIMSIFSNTIVVKDILITQPQLSVEQQMPSNNLKILMENIQRSIPEGETDTNLIIEHLVIEDGSVYLRTDVGGKEERTIKLPRIEETDIGTEQYSVQQTIRELAEPVVERALRAALEGGFDQLKDKARDAIKDLFDNN